MDSHTVRFLLRPCWLGWILLAATPRGVLAIALGDGPELLTQDLLQHHPGAEAVTDDPLLEAWLARVLASSGALAAEAVPALPPLDLRGTPFRRRVWQELGLIPTGSTVSYAELARRLGAPRAVRAVAQACGANPIALAIPCHRVIGSDGSLRGYRWGLARKRALLACEAGRNDPEQPGGTTHLRKAAWPADRAEATVADQAMSQVSAMVRFGHQSNEPARSPAPDT